MQATKKGDAFFVYAIPTLDLRMQQHEMLIHYQDYKDIFEKKNANTLWRAPNSLKDLNVSPKQKTSKEWGVEARSLACSILEG